MRSTRSNTSAGDDRNGSQIPPSNLPSALPPVGKDNKLGNSQWIQVQDVFKVFALSPDEVAHRFFGGVSTWLPIISPQCFRKRLQEVQDETPSPEFSLLLLAMSLIIIHPLERSSHASSIGLEDLYRITKSTLADVQTTTDISATMIQASILIAAYEYACGRLQTAYISIGVSSRMSHIIGLDQHKPKVDTGYTDLEALERRNIWWGLIILERQILIEGGRLLRCSRTIFPSDDVFLPSLLDRLDEDGCGRNQCPSTILPIVRSSNIDAFGRQGQVAHFLEQTMSVLTNKDEDDIKISTLRNIDDDMQQLLAITMSEYRGPGSHCGANATGLRLVLSDVVDEGKNLTRNRTLYLIHQAVFEISTTSTMSKPTNALNSEGSSAAMDAAVNMMAEVARDHLTKITNIDRLPPCAGYNFELCIRHLEACGSSLGRDSHSNGGLSDLKQMVGAFRRRWPKHGSATL
ncbi:Fungal specific transcription factor domain-containing protein [Cladophialophora immunda]|nr:Fungal specific transcription factor domain-containing protein [Cladophialophora immunda]